MDPVEKARSQLGKLRYVLGAGGRNPAAKSPGSVTGGCDCSGFVAWCLGYDRRQPEPIGWLSTDAIVRMAEDEGNRYFQITEDPIPGDVVVYPGKWAAGKRIRVGHCGIVSNVPGPRAKWGKNWGGMRVIHCSAGNDRLLGYAVADTAATVFAKNGAIFVSYLGPVVV